MRMSLIVALLLALGCARRPPPPTEEDEAVAKVCAHVGKLCGRKSDRELCVSSAKAMRATNLAGARDLEACALAKTRCEEVATCTLADDGAKTTRTSLRRLNEQRGKAEGEPAR